MTTITNPRDKRVQAIFLKGHCKLRAAGMNARGTTAAQCKAMAENVTGKKYKRGAWDEMVTDLQAIIDAGKGGQ